MIDEDQAVEIRTLESAHEMRAIVTVFSQVWGSVTPLVGIELLRAIAHSGGYVAAAFDGDHVLGASFGFLARHAGAPALHSHVTGVLPGVQHTGIGRTMKTHQRAWAADHGLDWVTWTFDPLVRRNAWFNIEVLHAEIAEYLVDFYGPMADSVNRRDETDRLLVAWSTSDDHAGRRSLDGPLVEVATPEDVVVLRRTDPAEAMRWRLAVRDQLGTRLDAGAVVEGFTRDGAYLVREPA